MVLTNSSYLLEGPLFGVGFLLLTRQNFVYEARWHQTGPVTRFLGILLLGVSYEGGHSNLPPVPWILPPSAKQCTTQCQASYHSEIKEPPIYFEYAVCNRVHRIYWRFLLWLFSIAGFWNYRQDGFTIQVQQISKKERLTA